MARRYHLSPLPPAGQIELPAELTRHLRSVRARPGDRFRVFDGAGLEADAELLEAGRGPARAMLGTTASVRREPTRRVELACALPKGGRADWLFEHATEIGVAAFHPLRTARSARAEARSGSMERWERIVRAAAGQCDRSHLPTIHPERDLAVLLAAADLPGSRWLAAPGSEAVLGPSPESAVLLIGPEGGLTADEIEAATRSGFRPVSLGPLTLRAETAALVGAARLLG